MKETLDFTTKIKSSNIILKNDFGAIRSANNKIAYQIKSMYKIHEGVKNESNLF